MFVKEYFFFLGIKEMYVIVILRGVMYKLGIEEWRRVGFFECGKLDDIYIQKIIVDQWKDDIFMQI